MTAAVTSDSTCTQGVLYGSYQGTFDNVRGELEQVLNILGYFPFISRMSGSVRVIYGKVFLITSLAMTAFYGVKSACEVNAERRVEYNYKAVIAVTEIAHSLENIIRGVVEAMPIVGNMAMMMYDIIFSRHAYRGEGVY